MTRAAYIFAVMKSIVCPPPVVCAWCPTFDPRDPINRVASHGMCRDCAARFKREFDDDDAKGTP